MDKREKRNEEPTDGLIAEILLTCDGEEQEIEIQIPADLQKELEALKQKEPFQNKTFNEMFTELIERGLEIKHREKQIR